MVFYNELCLYASNYFLKISLTWNCRWTYGLLTKICFCFSSNLLLKSRFNALQYGLVGKSCKYWNKSVDPFCLASPLFPPFSSIVEAVSLSSVIECKVETTSQVSGIWCHFFFFFFRLTDWFKTILNFLILKFGTTFIMRGNHYIKESVMQ